MFAVLELADPRHELVDEPGDLAREIVASARRLARRRQLAEVADRGRQELVFAIENVVSASMLSFAMYCSTKTS